MSVHSVGVEAIRRRAHALARAAWPSRCGPKYTMAPPSYCRAVPTEPGLTRRRRRRVRPHPDFALARRLADLLKVDLLAADRLRVVPGQETSLTRSVG